MINMNYKKTFSFLFCLLTLSLMVSCGGDDEPDLTPEEQRILDLTGTTGITWKATSVTFDGAPANGLDNFSITLRSTNTSKVYSSRDGDPFLNPTGSWSFNGTNLNQLIFDADDANIYAITNINSSTDPATLTMTVNFTKGGGLAAGVKGADGTYVFNLEAQ